MSGLVKRVLVSAAVVGGLFGAVAAQAAPKEDLKGTNVVLVHGAFADGSSWNRVIPLLEARGLHVVSVQNPLSSLADDAAATKRTVDAQKGPVVLVGHSWAGVVISEAGNDDKVKSLVYVAAFAPDLGPGLLGDKAHSMVFDNAKVKALAPDFRTTVTFDEGARRIIAHHDAHPELQVVDDDLDAALTDLPGAGPWRVQFHVPLHTRPAPPLTSTTDVLVDAMTALDESGRPRPHVEVETYTWNVMPGREHGEEDLVEGIARELDWTRQRFLEHGAEVVA